MENERQVIPKATGRELHDRVTRGDTLTETEQAALRAWYDAEDAAETSSLQVVSAAVPDMLRAEIDAALTRLQEVTDGVQRLSAENSALRRENAELAHRLTRLTQAA